MNNDKPCINFLEMCILKLKLKPKLMKKGMLLLFVSGALLVSCGPSAEDAASDICDCYKDASALADKAGNAESPEDLMQITEEIQAAVEKGDKCKAEWDEKYNGKVDVEEFKTALKAKDEKIYKMLDERGLF